MKALFSLVFSLVSLATFAQEKPLDSLVNEYASQEGLITTYWHPEKSKLLLAVNDSLLGKPLLMVTRYVSLPANYSAYRNAGSKTAESVISFEREANKIVLKQLSYVNLAEEGDPIAQSVVQNNLAPILSVFEKMNSEKQIALFDATDFFSKDSPGFNAVGETEKRISKSDQLIPNVHLSMRCAAFR
jgi:hypothetical protein